MKIWIPMLLYLSIQSITPGPNNLTCLYLGGNYGLRGVLKFLSASMLGLLVKSILCGSLNLVLAEAIPPAVSVLKWFGAAYMLYLAWTFLKSGWAYEEKGGEKREAASFRDGIILQLLNAKSWIASVSTFAVYVIPISSAFSTVLWVSAAFVVLAAIASVIWAVAGSALKKLIARYRKSFAVIMALALVWCAVSAVL